MSRPHLDTPKGCLQFAFALTDLATAHVAFDKISFEEAIKNLNTFGLELNEGEKSNPKP
jgi:glutaredoxin-related protein